jgi:hypothetical protein
MYDEFYGVYDNDKMDDFFRHIATVHMNESAPFRHFITTFNNRVKHYSFQTSRSDLLDDMIFLKSDDDRLWVFRDSTYNYSSFEYDMCDSE